MKNVKIRKANRTNVNMNLRSAQLPHYAAKVVDLSEDGAKLRLKGAVSPSLVEERIRFSASLANQIGTAFQGYARVAWVKETANGVEAGLQWEKMTASALQAVKAALVSAVI